MSITELFPQTLFGKTGDRLASNSALKVNKHLQLEGYDNIYAIGDCADLKEPKMAYHAGLHANVAVTNIINSLTHKPLKTYEPGKVISFPVGTAVKCAHIGTCAGHGLEVREPTAGVDCVSLELGPNLPGTRRWLDSLLSSPLKPDNKQTDQLISKI